MLSPVEAREAVHVLVLQKLQPIADESRLILKGGVSLRLFFSSIRYSADMDLDGDPDASLAIRTAIKEIFSDRAVATALRHLGLRGLDPGEGPNKDTETTFRYKFGVMGAGGVRYATKVEVSFRDRFDGDGIELTKADTAITQPYLGSSGPLLIPHYDRKAAVRQKIVALADRAAVQARDVFDLKVLAPEGGEARPELLRWLADVVEQTTIKTALDRTMEMSFSEFEGQVLEFLSVEAREEYRWKTQWEEVQLTAAGLLEATLAHHRKT
jgi:predicted nucleotidyltransferase component of viral defense system